MPVVAVRVWLPDRPGALGAVASRIGSVGGDVIGIDIVDRGAGRAVDELVVDLPDEALVHLLMQEVAAVDDVDVEDVRVLDGPPPDPAVAALGAARLLRDADAGSWAKVLADSARTLLVADWSAVVEVGGGLLASAGDDVPTEAWLTALVAGATAGGSSNGLGALAVATTASGAAALVVARDRLPLRGREQQVLDGLAALV